MSTWRPETFPEAKEAIVLGQNMFLTYRRLGTTGTARRLGWPAESCGGVIKPES